MFTLAHVATTIVSAALTWLFWDALKVGFEEKTFLKALGFGILALVSLNQVFQLIINADAFAFSGSNLSFWLTSIAYFAIFLSFALDEHFIIKPVIILAILAILFLRGHWQLTTQTLLVSISVLQLTYTTKHRDLIPFAIGFVLITIAEFFLSMESSGLELAALLLYLIAQGALILWWWSYVAIRFSINSLGPRLKV